MQLNSVPTAASSGSAQHRAGVLAGQQMGRLQKRHVAVIQMALVP